MRRWGAGERGRREAAATVQAGEGGGAAGLQVHRLLLSPSRPLPLEVGGGIPPSLPYCDLLEEFGEQPQSDLPARFFSGTCMIRMNVVPAQKFVESIKLSESEKEKKNLRIVPVPQRGIRGQLGWKSEGMFQNPSSSQAVVPRLSAMSPSDTLGPCPALARSALLPAAHLVVHSRRWVCDCILHLFPARTRCKEEERSRRPS